LPLPRRDHPSGVLKARCGAGCLRSRLSMTSSVSGCALCACWAIFRADPLVAPIPDRPPVELPVAYRSRWLVGSIMHRRRG
jgi:hypothetical protein